MVQLLHDNAAFPGGLDIWRANEPTDLPPIGRWDRRLRDYPVNYGYFFRDPRARVTQFGMEVLATFNPAARVTQFGIEILVTLSPQGAQLSGNPPAGRARSVDYSFIQQIGVAQLAFVQPPIPGDFQASSTALPPRGPARARDYTWFNQPLPVLFAQDTMLPDHSTDATALPTPAPARSRDYSFTASYTQSLIGQDAIPTGVQLSGNTPPARPRASTLSDPGANAVIYLTAPLPTLPVGHSQAPSDLAPRAAPRAVDYTWLRSLPIHLIGQDALNPGDQSFELPPRGPQRLRDYTWLYTLPTQFPPAAASVASAPYMWAQDLPPRGWPNRNIGYPSLTRSALPLLLTPSGVAEQFQVILIL